MTQTVTNLGVNQNIVFDKVFLNLGDGYHSNQGVFIAPTSGIYLFSASVTSDSKNTSHEFDTCVTRNGECLARILGHGDSSRNDQGSATVTVSLQPNDEVWIKHMWPAGAGLRGQYFTSFTGLMVVHSL